MITEAFLRTLFLENEQQPSKKKITRQWCSAEMKTTGKNPANLEQKEKTTTTTKIVTYPLL